MANGDTTFYCIVLPGSAWEVGFGTWVTGNTLQRSQVYDSSNAGALVNFPAGTKDVFCALPAQFGNALKSCFNSGVLMLFQQTTAPVYWTKQVTHNDKALRVVSGAAGSGGATAFSSILNGTIGTNGGTLSVSTMPSHSHAYETFSQVRNDGTATVSTMSFHIPGTTGSTGGDGAHSHGITMNIAYVDLIICSKD
jgi:hypothetical protein